MSTAPAKKESLANKGKEESKKNKKDEPVEEELNEADQQLKDNIDSLIVKVAHRDQAQRMSAIGELKNLIVSATSGITSVPAPLKFLSPHYNKLKQNYDSESNQDVKKVLSDLVSVIGMVAADDQNQYDALKFALQGTRKNLVSWGHEYLRCLSGQIGVQYEERLEKDESTDDILELVDQIIPEFINHNEEAEAVDLLMEVERSYKLTEFCNENNFERVCHYMLSCAAYAADTEEMLGTLRTVYDCFKKFKRYPDALRVAQKMHNMDLVKEVMSECQDPITLKQMAYMLGRQRTPYESEDDEITRIVSNEKLSEHFKALARDLDTVAPKHPDAIYKTHLEDKRYAMIDVDSAKKNLAMTYVNAFVNAGYGKDLLITNEELKEDWIFKTKEDGQTAAAASLGMILLWDIDEGIAQIDKYMDRRENHIVAGSFMALGLVNSGITNECDPVQAILVDKLESCQEAELKIGALMGLSFTYAGSARADLLEAISPIILDSGNSTQLQAVAALAIGLIYVGTCDEDAAQSILQTLMEKEEKELDDPFTRLFALGLGLLFLGQQAAVDASMEVCKLIPNQKYADFVELVVETCAYAGSGNVLKVQKMLHLCAEHKEDSASIHQVAAVLGVAMVAFGEQIGTEMCLRTMSHLLQYGEPSIRRTVPLAMGLLRVSSPSDMNTMDLLNKLAYDSDAEVSMSSILALGLIGAGTNNSKLAGNLRYLASYYQAGQDSQNQLFVVRIAQGLVHMGKGLLGLNPFHSDKLLFSPSSLAGLLTTLYAATDMNTFICGKYHYFLFYLTLSMYPRMFITLNEQLEPIKTSVRVGNAIDTVGQAGKPRKITGFQTHETPVLIGHGERAELGTEEFLAESSVLENFVILRPNPDYIPDEKEAKDKK